MNVFALFVPSNFKDHLVETIPYPADGPILLGGVGALVQVIGMGENSCTASKPIPRLGLARSFSLFRGSNRDRIWYNTYTTIPKSVVTIAAAMIGSARASGLGPATQ